MESKAILLLSAAILDFQKQFDKSLNQALWKHLLYNAQYNIVMENSCHNDTTSRHAATLAFIWNLIC